MEFDIEDPLLTTSQGYQYDTISKLFASEVDLMPSLNYIHCLNTNNLHASFREEAVSLILQVQYSCNYDASISYLAFNYMDRFFSVQEFPEGKPWLLRLIVMSFISLATKMKNMEFCVSNFQGEEDHYLDSQTISRMEILVLDALNWRTRSITPFCFINYFVSLSEIKDSQSLQALKECAYESIIKIHHEMKLLVFKPSIIAASVLLVAVHDLLPLQFASFQCSICSCKFVDQDMLQKCYDATRGMFVGGRCESISNLRTPLSVLERHCFVSSEGENPNLASCQHQLD